MQPLTDLKAILHSKRANIYYLEYCRVLYLTESSKENLRHNNPFIAQNHYRDKFLNHQ